MFSRFCPSVLEYCSAVWCSAADTHLHYWTAAEHLRTAILFFRLSVSVERPCWPCVGSCGTGGFQEQILFYWQKLLAHFWSFTVFPFSSFFLEVGIVGLGSLHWWAANRSFPALHCRRFNNNNNNNANNNCNNNNNNNTIWIQYSQHECGLDNYSTITRW